MKKVYDEEISKRTDWGGDETTGGLPVSGRRVQEFLKKELNGKAGLFHYDTTNNRYIVFADEANRDLYLADPTRTELIIGMFDAPFNYSAQIALTTPAYVSILAATKNNYIDFTFDTFNKQGTSVGEPVVCTYTFIKGGVKKVVTEKYQPATEVHFKIDDYLSTGTNTITVGVVGQNTLAATTVGITYNVIELSLADGYDLSMVHDLVSNPASVAAIPYTVGGYGTKVMEWMLDGVLLEYVKGEDEIVDISASRTKYIPLRDLSHGIHRLQFRAYVVMNGEKFYSDILYRDLILTTGANLNPIVAVAATIPSGCDPMEMDHFQLYGVTQYVPYEFRFAVYDPTHAPTLVAEIALDGTLLSTLTTTNGVPVDYSLRSTDWGVRTLTITALAAVYTIGMNVSKSTTSLEEVADGLQLSLSALGKSNSDANREQWAYGDYSTAFFGFSWNERSGWQNNRLLITSGAHIEVDIVPLKGDATLGGKTLEFEFATSNVLDNDAVICDCRNPSSGTGLLITASQARMVSSGGSKVVYLFKSEENIRVAFVINKKAGTTNKGLLFIYINGVLSQASHFGSMDSFRSDATLAIGGSTQADVSLKELRFYDAALTDEQILNNYMLYRDTTEEMLGAYDRNDVYESGTQNFSVDRLATQLPVMIITGDVPVLENTTDKNETIYVDIDYINLQDPTRAFTAKGARMRPQGTSSMGYPKKNFRIYLSYGTLYDASGSAVEGGKYQFRGGAQPVGTFCLKADYAESSGAHNTGIARMWNTCMANAQVDGEYVCRTEAQKCAAQEKYPYDVRTTIDGFPVVLLYRPTADDDLVLLGKYNFNNDKSTESVFGFKDVPGFDNSKMQCWEVLNNGNHLALFADVNGFDKEWAEAYEARYPEDSTDAADLKAFSAWVVSTKGNAAKFREEKWEHLDVYKVAAYYIYLMRFGAVDQVVKNAMLTSENGAQWFFINYDNDTINGLRNDGLLIYNYELTRQTIDTSFSALVYAYAGHDSTLWNNLEADSEFMDIVSKVDNALYVAGLSYANVIKMFDAEQSGKWCERLFNQDSRYKYIGPYTDSGVNNLFMLQGSRSAHRRWWLSHRFDLLDSQYVSGAYKAKSIEWKVANAPAGIPFKITSGSDIYYGYGLNNVPVERGVRLAVGESKTFTTKQVINVGDPVRVYSAVNVMEIDIHEFITYLSTCNIAEVYNSTVGTKLKKLVLGVDATTDQRVNTSLSVVSGLSQAALLEHLDISGFQSITDLDLTANKSIRVLKAFNSGLTGVTIPNGAPIETLQLPDSVQTIRLDNLPMLGSGFSIKNYGRNVRTMFIRHCPKFDSKAFVFNWNANRVSEAAACSLTLEGVDWKGVESTDLVKLGEVKDAGGVLSLKGKIVLNSVTIEQLTRLKEIFGVHCTDPGNELYVKAPNGIYLTGASEILEGKTAQYSASVFSDAAGGTVEYWLANGGAEVEACNGASINKETGLVTTTETGVARVIKVRAKYIPVKGGILKSDVDVAVNKRVYPQILTISGDGKVSYVGDCKYDLTASALTEITGEYTVEWALSGTPAEQGLVELSEATKDHCSINVKSIPADIVSFTITATAKKVLDDSIVVAGLKNIDMVLPGVIMTANSNPEVMRICHAQGWAAHTNYMTEQEASDVNSIGGFFFGNKVITNFDEFQYFTNVTALDNNVFNSCTNLKSIVLPDSVKRVGYGAFGGCVKLKKIRMPESLDVLGRDCFYECLELEEVNLPIVAEIQTCSFFNCIMLKTITIPEGVKTIGDSCFSSCLSLESITLPLGFEVIGDYSFSGCSSLTNAVLPDSVTKIGTDSFSGCTNLKTIRIPNGIKAPIHLVDNLPGTFISSGIERFIVDENNTEFSAIDGVLFSKDQSKLFIYPYAKKETAYVVPESVTAIYGYAFHRYQIEDALLESVILPNGIKTLGRSAFGANIFSSIVLPEGITEMSYEVFIHCKNLTEITIPSSIDYIESNAFSFCNSLSRVNFAPIVDKLILDNTFTYCDALESIDLPKGVILNGSVFGYCKGLKSIAVPEGNTVLNGTFSNCLNLENVILPASVTNIAGNTFPGCAALKSITCKATAAPVTSVDTFGYSVDMYTGRNNFDKGVNKLYVPSGATGYDASLWLDPLQDATKCGFTVSYTL